MFGIIGQEKLIELFHTSLENNRLSHSYLIEGDEGLCSINVAKYMAASLLCKQGKQGACTHCSICRRIQDNNHPDIRVIDEKTVKIDNIRKAIEEVHKRPYEANHKVIIIKGFHTTTIEGQNAILKTLEEPPDTATIILLANDTLSILDTIKSRCQILKLFRVDTNIIKNKLIHDGYSNDRAGFGSLYGEGNYGESIKACSEGFIVLRNQIMEVALDIFSCSKFEVMNYAQSISNNKDNIFDILNIFTSIYRDIIMVKLDENNSKIINRDNFQIIVEESYRLSYNRLDKALRVINDTRKRLASDTNFQLTMEVMLLNIQEAK
ncbi:MAG: DNA polymerase III subunit delta' C-terminal domain-containing protein [Clostridium sp.]